MAAVDNALIARLADPDRSHLLSQAHAVPLALSQVLWQSGDLLTHVYFPTRGLICLIVTVPTQAGLEIAMVGREGMLGIHAVLDNASAPFRAVVQGEGQAWCVTTEFLRQHLAHHPATKQLLDRYATFRLNQLATLAQCLHQHEVGPRLARWLLMYQDRTSSNCLQVTQDALGQRLGVRRASVTAAAVALQDRGVIAYHRGNLQVLDRGALERAACGCYRSNLEGYRALF